MTKPEIKRMLETARHTTVDNDMNFIKDFEPGKKIHSMEFNSITGTGDTKKEAEKDLIFKYENRNNTGNPLW